MASGTSGRIYSIQRKQITSYIITKPKLFEIAGTWFHGLSF